MLEGYSGDEISAPKKLGNPNYPEIEAAPDRYVKERVF